VRSAESVVDFARTGRLADLHVALLCATAQCSDAPTLLLRRLGDRLQSLDIEAEELPIRQLVVMRLLAAGAADAAWLVLQDNAVGVVPESFGRSTSSGAPRTARRLPLTTLVEPPRVYAWLPGLRDPRHGAPESAYDVTDLVTLRARLDELWWERDALVLAGSAHLRHIAASPDDTVEIVCTGPDGCEHVVAGTRRRRPEHVRGIGGDLTRLAWAGWSARLPAGEFPSPGTWRLSLRLREQGIERCGALGGWIGELVPPSLRGPGGAEARIAAGGLEVQLPARRRLFATRVVLHPVAELARRR